MVKPCAKEMKCDVEVGIQVQVCFYYAVCVLCFQLLLLLQVSTATTFVCHESSDVLCKFEISFSRGIGDKDFIISHLLIFFLFHFSMS